MPWTGYARRMLLPGILAATVLAAAPPLGDLPSLPAPIYGGTAVAPGEWPAVVAISVGTFLCTGTLVSPNVVITAAHCLDSDPSVANIVVRRGHDINSPVPAINAIAYGADPEFCGEETCKEDIHDYGFIILASSQNDVPAFPRAIADQHEWDDLMRVNNEITVVGYGLNEGDITGIKRQVEIPITRFSGSGREFQAGGMGMDSCQGDSGGPAFAKLGDEWLLVGITSRGYTCGKGGFYAVPLGGACWLAQESGFDLRPADCEACDCINTDPTRNDGCGCATGDPRAGASGSLALLALLAALRRRRRR